MGFFVGLTQSAGADVGINLGLLLDGPGVRPGVLGRGYFWMAPVCSPRCARQMAPVCFPGVPVCFPGVPVWSVKTP